MAREVTPNQIAGVGKAIGKLRGAGIQKQAGGLDGGAGDGKHPGADFLLLVRDRVDDGNRAHLPEIRVKFPVFCALGIMEFGTVKIAPTSQPSMQCPQ